MEAKETSLSFLHVDQLQFVIPFFQRPYVWEEKNWERLLDSLKNDNSSHYLGSIIVQMNTKQNEDGFFTCSVIDGQQRITTLSILMRALMDNIGNNSTVNTALSCMLFCRYDPSKKHTATIRGKSNSVVKLVPGFHDKDAYTALIKNPEEAIAQYPDNQLIACYQFFKEETNNKKLATSIFRLLTNELVKFIVKITLESGDNAQAIFDVSNGTGVSLTCADIIKNDVFLHINEQKRLSVYGETWEKVFDGEDYDYWTSIYNSRANIENLLFAVAQIEKNGSGYIYDANNDTFETLSDKYRSYFDRLSQPQLEAFVKRLMKYANIYRNHLTIDKNQQFSQTDPIPRYMLSFSNLNACTVLFPFLLKVFEKRCEDDGTIKEGKEQEIIDQLQMIERLLIRSAIVQNTAFADKRFKPSTKNFNKTIIRVVESSNPEELFTKDQLTSINDNDLVKTGLKAIDNNTAKIVLFLLNLKQAGDLGKTTNVTAYAYNYELEHVMPQEFRTHWGLPTTDKDGSAFDSTTDPAEYRESFVYQIGNMTIITPKANKTIKNYPIKTKMQGDATKTTKGGIRKGYQGYEKFASEPISSELKTSIIAAGYKWDEKMIADRTEKLTSDILTIWG